MAEAAQLSFRYASFSGFNDNNKAHGSLGWLTAIGWQVYLASVCFLVGTIIQGLLVLNDPTYVYERWHGTLLAIAIVCFSIIFNTVLASRLPLIGKLRKSGVIWV